MAKESFERQDIMNGLALGGVLLLLTFGIVLGALSCSNSLKSVSVGEKKQTTTTSTTEPSTPDAAVEEAVPARNPSEVTVRVGNGANISGLATSGTRLLSQNEYEVLQGKTKKGDPIESSVVYYIEGFKSDAEQIASLLNIPSTQVETMPDDPGIPIDNADVIVILGQDAEF